MLTNSIHLQLDHCLFYSTLQIDVFWYLIEHILRVLINALQNHAMIATACLIWKIAYIELHLLLHFAAISTYLNLIMYTGNNTVDENFYPFGVSAGDVQVPVALDGSSPPISLLIPVRFFETSENILFVSQLLAAFIYMQTEINVVNCIIIYVPVVMICNSCYPFCLYS